MIECLSLKLKGEWGLSIGGMWLQFLHIECVRPIFIKTNRRQSFHNLKGKKRHLLLDLQLHHLIWNIGNLCYFSKQIWTLSKHLETYSYHTTCQMWYSISFKLIRYVLFIIHLSNVTSQIYNISDFETC